MMSRYPDPFLDWEDSQSGMLVTWSQAGESPTARAVTKYPYPEKQTWIVEFVQDYESLNGVIHKRGSRIELPVTILQRVHNNESVMKKVKISLIREMIRQELISDLLEGYECDVCGEEHVSYWEDDDDAELNGDVVNRCKYNAEQPKEYKYKGFKDVP